GINHFMLPGKANLEKIAVDEDARYGINSMELMINAMMKKGASRTRLEAKVFGGGKVMKAGLNNVAENNVGFITRYLEIEEIPVIASDVGGKHGRKIILLPGSFSVYVRKIKKHKLVNETVAEEKKLLSKVKDQKKEKSNITYFAQGDK
ncbi:MAG: chemotaxis protein CheD, partial [Halanaerobiaceae bacterium]